MGKERTGVPIYIYIHYGALFFALNLAICLNCKFPINKKNLNVMHTLVSILFFKTYRVGIKFFEMFTPFYFLFFIFKKFSWYLMDLLDGHITRKI